MSRAGGAVERMVTVACSHGYTREQALQAVILACDHVIEANAGNSLINVAYMRAIRGEAMRKWRATPSETSARMRARREQRG